MASASLDRPILVTGFGPFRNYLVNVDVNASWVVAQELAEMTVYNPDRTPCKLEIREIPVEYETVSSTVPQLWKDLHPRLCIHMGVDPYQKELPRINIEVASKNAIYRELDMKQRCPDSGKCVPDGPAYIRTQVDVQRVVTRVMSAQTDVRVATSPDAGRYLCGFIYYTSLHYGDAPVIFIHIPPIDQPYSCTQMAATLKLIIETILTDWEQCVTQK